MVIITLSGWVVIVVGSVPPCFLLSFLFMTTTADVCSLRFMTTVDVFNVLVVLNFVPSFYF